MRKILSTRNYQRPPIDFEYPKCETCNCGIDRKIKIPFMAKFSERLKTFKYWPKHWGNAKELAESGLFSTGINDIVLCYCCGLSMSRMQDLSVYAGHLRKRKSCRHIQMVKNLQDKKNDEELINIQQLTEKELKKRQRRAIARRRRLYARLNTRRHQKKNEPI